MIYSNSFLKSPLFGLELRVQPFASPKIVFHSVTGSEDLTHNNVSLYWTEMSSYFWIHNAKETCNVARCELVNAVAWFEHHHWRQIIFAVVKIALLHARVRPGSCSLLFMSISPPRFCLLILLFKILNICFKNLSLSSFHWAAQRSKKLKWFSHTTVRFWDSEKWMNILEH